MPYFISSFPGCTEKEMGAVEQFLKKERWNLQQVQDFIPLPMTGSAAMYVTGPDINTGKPIPVVRNAGDRERQKRMLRPEPAPRDPPDRQPQRPGWKVGSGPPSRSSTPSIEGASASIEGGAACRRPKSSRG